MLELREIRKRQSVARLPAVLELTDRFKKLERTQGAARSVKRAAIKRERFQAKTSAREAAQREGGVTLTATDEPAAAATTTTVVPPAK